MMSVHSRSPNRWTTEMAIPDYQTLMLPVLEFAARGESSVRDCVVALAQKLDLTEDERSELLPSGKQAVFANRVHWAKTYLVQAGLLEITRRAHFRLTLRGSEVLTKRPATGGEGVPCGRPWLPGVAP
jgi:restriction system protein